MLGEIAIVYKLSRIKVDIFLLCRLSFSCKRWVNILISFVGNVCTEKTEELNSHVAQLMLDSESNRQELTQLRTTVKEQV